MNGSIWQLTKRRWVIVATEPGMYIAFAITVIGFAALGPFGTFSIMPITERIGFWFLVHAVSWVAASLIIVPSRFTLEHLGMPALPAFVVASLGANVAIAPIFIWFLARHTDASLSPQISIGLFVIVAAVISAITFVVLRVTGIEVIPANLREKRRWLHEAELAVVGSRSPETEIESSDCAMLGKLPADKRGTLLAMIAHDHYVEVVTDRGRHLLLMRFSDAVDVCEPCDGIRVHRSAWVAREGMSDIIAKGRRMWIALPDGSMVNVSRQHHDDVREFVAGHEDEQQRGADGSAAAQFNTQ